MTQLLRVSATPTPYIETILPGRTSIKGWVGTIDNNKVMPEPNAYIYVYINNFLINPPDTLPDGTYKNTDTAVVSDAEGNWSTNTFFFGTIPPFEYGAVITFRAKAPLKSISEASVPYAIGATPTPIDLGVYDSLGKKRRPYEGETSIMGRISYWFRQLPDAMGNTGYPQFNCDTHVYVYVDGVHQGSTEAVIGEVYRNEIRGLSATYPIFDNIRNHVLPIKIGETQINIPFYLLNPSDTPDLTGTQDGVNTEFAFTIEESNVGFRVFKNGLRLTYDRDYVSSVIQDPTNSRSIVTLSFLSNPPYPVDAITILVQYNISSIIYHETPYGVKDGINTVFTLAQPPFPGTLEIFKNGLKLDSLSGNDYTVQNKTVTLTTPVEADDVFIADYQPLLQNAVPLVYSSQLIGEISPPNTLNPNTSFLIELPDNPGNVHVFKNGIKLRKGVNADYTNVESNIIEFTLLGAPKTGDVLNASFYTAPVSLQQLVKYLNNLPEFTTNCLQASINNILTIENSFIISDKKDGVNTHFFLPLVDVPVDVRLYKNGRRLVKISPTFPSGDYSLDYNSAEIIFVVPPLLTDTIMGLFTYRLTDFITEKKLQPTSDPLKYALDFVPKIPSVSIYVNGIRLDPLATPPLYTIENNLVVFPSPPPENSVLVTDYEIAYGLNNLVSNVIPEGNIDGANPIFMYPPQLRGTAINVFKNGFLQVPGINYVITNNAIMFLSSYENSYIPQVNDVIVIEFNLGPLFTDNPKDQLKISSPYAIELVNYEETSYVQKLLFGDKSELWPGKGEDGDFMFWINRQTGYWKWTWYNPYTKETTPFTTGQHITARAYNSAKLVYTSKV